MVTGAREMFLQEASGVWYLINLFNKYLYRAYYVPATILSA